MWSATSTAAPTCSMRLLGKIREDLERRPVRKGYFSPSSATSSIADRARRKWSKHLRAHTGIPACARCSSSATTRRSCFGSLAETRALITEWRKLGGAECLRSYGVDLDQIADWMSTGRLWPSSERLSREHVEFLQSFDDSVGSGIFCSSMPGSVPAFRSKNRLRPISAGSARRSCSTTGPRFRRCPRSHDQPRGRGASQPDRDRHGRLSERRADRLGLEGSEPLDLRYARSPARFAWCRGLIWSILVLTVPFRLKALRGKRAFL